MTQLERLQALIAAITPGNRFYRDRLALSNLNENVASLEEFAARMPLTTKADLIADQTANPPYGTNLSFPLEHYTRFCQTSGTTATPLVILDTPESWDWMLDNWRAVYRAAELRPGDCVYFAFSFGPFLGFWTAFESAARTNYLCIPGGGLSSVARIRAILRHRVNVLCCTPTYALHLAEIAKSEKLPLETAVVEKIIVAGEPGGSIREVRDRISDAWNGAVVVDHYGMTEVGPVAFQPFGERDLEIIEESYLWEVVDPASGTAVSGGAPGELVLTTLGRTAAPLLRYRTGDLVQPAHKNGRLVLKNGIIGRSDDMIVVRGVNLYPSAVDAIVRSIRQVSEYRVRVANRGSLAELTVEVESDDSDCADHLEAAFRTAFSLRIPVKRVSAGTLPRFEMKARRWHRDHENSSSPI